MQLTIVLCAFIVGCASKELPSYIEKCKLTDEVATGKCIIDRVEKLRSRLEMGIPEMKLPPIEPLRLPQMEIHTGSGTNVAFDAVLTDIEIRGLKDVIVNEVTFDLNKKRGLVRINVPHLHYTGTYELKGKVLLFEIQAKGPVRANITDVDALTKFKFDLVSKNGKRYINIRTKDVEVTNSFRKASLYFENLFNNKEINEQINNSINENVQELSQEVGPLIHEASHLVVVGLLKPVFKDYSLEELFINP